MVEDEKFQELVMSIMEFGILEPLLVADTPAGYQLIAGERRWRAAKKIGLEEVPVRLIETTPKGMLEIALVENIQRVDFNPLEKAKGMKRLMDEFGHTLETLAKKLGQSAENLRADLRLLTLPDPIKDALSKDLINQHHAEAFLLIKDQRQMLECFRKTLEKKLPSEATLALARVYAAAKKEKVVKVEDKIKQHEQQNRKWQLALKKTFEQPAALKLARSNKQTKLTITFAGNKDRTQEDLDKIMTMFGVEKVS
ncbi:ParB/RepB/Spo0J family partition protein [Microgenomates group bacterium]|nr:ParB/RepB/Spo0J family partition protein [Microgenomates group bacterium]